MKVEPTALHGVLLLRAPVHADARGFLTEVWHGPRYADLGVPAAFVQDNHSRSVRGVIRGLHWQAERPQGKLVSVIRGAILDVVVDIRVGSPTEGRVLTVELVEGTGDQLWIPPGLAHGFCVLSDVADVLYKNTEVYRPELGRGVVYNDPDLGIRWPVQAPILSHKDRALPRLRDVADRPRFVP